MVALIPPGAVRASSWITDHLVTGSPARTDIRGLSHPLDALQSAEFAGAQADLGAEPAEMLLGAFGRAMGRAVGDGLLDVDVDVDTRGGRTFGRAALRCQDGRGGDGMQLLAAGREALSGVQSTPPGTSVSDARFSYRTTVPTLAPSGTHLLALHACEGPDVLCLDWWYDGRSFDRSTVEDLAAQLPLALIAICAGQ